jgi:hypothetical protein
MRLWQIPVLKFPSQLRTMLSDDKRGHRELWTAEMQWVCWLSAAKNIRPPTRHEVDWSRLVRIVRCEWLKVMSSPMVAESETAGLTSVVKDSLILLPGRRPTNERICVSVSRVATSDSRKRLVDSEQAKRKGLRHSSLHDSQSGCVSRLMVGRPNSRRCKRLECARSLVPAFTDGIC